LLGTVAVAAFIAIFLFGVPFPVVVIGAAAIGAIAAASGFLPGSAPKGESEGGHAAYWSGGGRAAVRPSWRHAAQVLATGLLLWLGPIILIRVLLGSDHLFAQQGLFFSKMALVTFGGAYAVLSYVAQAAVESYGWLTAPEMLDGLGLAETTPGPLILVLQFVGFIAAYRMPGALDPLLAGTLGSVIVLWATFAPCFLWIFLGAPYVEALRGRRVLNGALSAITAAVVGVIANLAVWFALHILFAELREMRAAGMVFHLPVWSSLDPAAAILAAGAVVAVLGMRAGLMPTLLGCGILGFLFRLVVN
jgi:chromate transporter